MTEKTIARDHSGKPVTGSMCLIGMGIWGRATEKYARHALLKLFGIITLLKLACIWDLGMNELN